MKFSKTIIASALLAGAGVAQAEITANVGAVSNYYFRGITQTDDGAAVQGGFDYGHDSGFYAGVWGSNVDFGGKESTEIDLYTGFGNDIGDTGIGYDVGAIYYAYPGAGGDAQGGDLDYAEIYVGASWKMISASFYYNVWGEVKSTPADNEVNDSGDYFWDISAELPLPESFSISAFFASADFDSRADDYYYWGASLSKDVGEFGSLSMNYEQNDGGGNGANVVATDDSAKFWLGWSKSF
ncbi:MAG: TorF family putative porin [Thiogranum sp.]